jgi:hypothetical protein
VFWVKKKRQRAWLNLLHIIPVLITYQLVLIVLARFFDQYQIILKRNAIRRA